MKSFSPFVTNFILLVSLAFTSDFLWGQGQAQDPAAMIQRFDKDSDGQNCVSGDILRS